MRPWDVLPSSPASALSVLFPTPLSLLFLSYGESDERHAKPPPTSNPPLLPLFLLPPPQFCLPACSLETNLARAELTKKRKKLLLSLSLSLSLSLVFCLYPGRSSLAPPLHPFGCTFSIAFLSKYRKMLLLVSCKDVWDLHPFSILTGSHGFYSSRCRCRP